LVLVAELESSLLSDTRELQSVCEDVLASGSVEQVSYLFNPPSILAKLADIDLDALAQMDAALSQSGHLPGTLPVLVPSSPAGEIVVPQPGPSHSVRRSSITMSEPTSIVDVLMAHPPVAILVESPPSLEVPKEDEAPEEDELAMSGVEEDTVEDKGKGVAEDETVV
jgi:hypothetical protein